MDTKYKITKLSTPLTISKCPTGISGLDEITGGGLPSGRLRLFVVEQDAGKRF